MSMSKKVVNKGKNKQGSSTSRILTVPILAVAGWLTTILPNVAVAASYSNDYSVCAGSLVKAGVTAEAASQGCAKALHPRDLAACVVKIEKQTQIAATDALSSCGKARRPEELATCVVGVSSSTKEAVNPAALDYCGRSLLPVRFGQCNRCFIFLYIADYNSYGIKSKYRDYPISNATGCANAADCSITATH
ncbi:hypothetical protein [Nostoc sp. JL34]|uniref:hypothetical protein n=1 Tax=Nostoc sp. JL34 TaxID=2815397 RepID=UPI003457A295